ncbi:coiled-coil domain-containing protein 178 [Neophocaena asiaeorientalis asiaeorientalis]|uniref:Coiled-coil domain-containing protein 178 n=1 Tax=Neophocaena asiaeorientalis asiaeorientalis TaxID=1706337 RepID=A0A341CGQ8_NEOAA|nr:coiled-coil domain-containing protein 178 [Neophocaena asiaeorientalis asiaeorientalis]
MVLCAVPQKDNATSQALVLFGAPKEAVEIILENKMTNTEGVNAGIYFSHPCRRKSCALVNIPAPCVNKMISHIEDVESKIQKHLKQFETSLEEWNRTSFTKELKDLSVATPVKEVIPEELRDEKCPELKQEMERLLSEAIQLIKSLETDRAEAEEALKQQKSRKKRISVQIDSWSIWKRQEIPLAVQKEHEAYLKDIVELRWHLEDKTHRLKRLEEEKEKLEEANAKLQADVDYMIKHRPLLLTKRDQELVALKEYYQKKTEVMELYKQIHGEYEEAVENLEKVKFKAKQSKIDMENDIRDDEITIETYKKEIDKLNSLFNFYCTSIQDVNIEENEEAVTEVLKETSSSRNELATLSETLEDLKRVYDQLVWKKKNYENEYLEALNNFYAAKRTWDIELSNIAKDSSDVSKACFQLMEENRRLEIDIETILGYISDSIRKKSELESEIQSLLQMRSKNEDFLKQLYKEAYNIGAIFHRTRFKTEELEQKIAEVRRKFKGREEFLKKLTRDEVANGMMIQKRLFSLQEEQALEKQDLMRKKTIYALALAEMEIPLLKLEEEAVKLRTCHKEHSDLLGEIIERKEYVKRNVEKTKKKLQRKGKKTQDALMKTEDKCSITFKEIETTKSKTSIYHAKITQLNKDLEEKQKEKNVFDHTLDCLKDQLIAMREKKGHAQAVFDHLINEKKACEERIYEEEQRYRTLFTMRQRNLSNVKKIQDDSLEENLRLAQEYQKLQNIFLTVKDNYFNLYEKQLSLDGSIRDKNQFCQLQRRIHKLWQKHFELVVLYSRMRLAKLQIDSQESIQKILAVQEESSNLMQHILDFFQTLTDGRCENDG